MTDRPADRLADRLTSDMPAIDRPAVVLEPVLPLAAEVRVGERLDTTS